MKLQEARDKAEKNIKLADHMLYATYPMINDPKLLLVIINNIFLAYTNSIAALLYYERKLDLTREFDENSFESKFNLFKQKSVARNKISKDYIKEIQNHLKGECIRTDLKLIHLIN